MGLIRGGAVRCGTVRCGVDDAAACVDRRQNEEAVTGPTAVQCVAAAREAPCLMGTSASLLQRSASSHYDTLTHPHPRDRRGTSCNLATAFALALALPALAGSWALQAALGKGQSHVPVKRDRLFPG